jgi:hypothetical protein
VMIGHILATEPSTDGGASSPFPRLGRLARALVVSMLALAPSQRDARQGAIDTADATWTSAAEGLAAQDQGFSDHCCGGSWIVPITWGFRSANARYVRSF